jgi:hypothetical protein
MVQFNYLLSALAVSSLALGAAVDFQGHAVGMARRQDTTIPAPTAPPAPPTITGAPPAPPAKGTGAPDAKAKAAKGTGAPPAPPVPAAKGTEAAGAAKAKAAKGTGVAPDVKAAKGTGDVKAKAAVASPAGKARGTALPQGVANPVEGVAAEAVATPQPAQATAGKYLFYQARFTSWLMKKRCSDTCRLRH